MASSKKSAAARRKAQVALRSAVARGVEIPGQISALASLPEVTAPAPVPEVCTVDDLRRVHRQVVAAEKRLNELRSRRQSILVDLASAGTPWAQLGEVVGLSRQAVRKWA